MGYRKVKFLLTSSQPLIVTRAVFVHSARGFWTGSRQRALGGLDDLSINPGNGVMGHKPTSMACV
jgi:hypothetical protein